LKVPRQCPFVLLVEKRLREGKALGSEEGKGLGRGACYEKRNEAEGGCTVYDRKIDINVEMAVSE
jgi:hypothetical protein